KMRGFKHIGEEENIPKSPEAEMEQAARLAEILLRREGHLPEAGEVEDDIREYAGKRAASAFIKNEESFIEFKGLRAYATLVDKVSGGDISIIMQRGTEALRAFSGRMKDKEGNPVDPKTAFVELRNEEAYARVIEPYKDQPDPHAAVIAAIRLVLAF
ncbi:hypothetical protein ACFLZ6_02405, partial [Nanoarchaeota archaeon]